MRPGRSSLVLSSLGRGAEAAVSQRAAHRTPGARPVGYGPGRAPSRIGVARQLSPASDRHRIDVLRWRACSTAIGISLVRVSGERLLAAHCASNLTESATLALVSQHRRMWPHVDRDV